MAVELGHEKVTSLATSSRNPAQMLIGKFPGSSLHLPKHLPERINRAIDHCSSQTTDVSVKVGPRSQKQKSSPAAHQIAGASVGSMQKHVCRDTRGTKVALKVEFADVTTIASLFGPLLSLRREDLLST
jgi:hypothetical protein